MELPSALNVDIGPHRRFDWVRTDLSEIKEIKNRLGGTVNDVVLAVVTGALRKFLQERGDDVDEVTLKALVPVSVRRDEEYGMTGNRVAAMMAPLPVYEEDPVERLRVISEELEGLKESGRPWALRCSRSWRVCAADSPRPGGPPAVAPALLQPRGDQRAGATDAALRTGTAAAGRVPLAPLAKRQGVCIAIMSYNGKLNFGLLADFDAMPDLEVIAAGISSSLDELRVAAGLRKTRARSRRRTPASANGGSRRGSGPKTPARDNS